MEIGFDSIINLFPNKIGLCLASGPSLKGYIDKIIEVSKNHRDNYAIFSVNELDYWFNLKSDVRVFANSELTIKNLFYELNKNLETIVMFADSVDMTPRWLYKFLLVRLKYLPFDQRHFNHLPCIPRAQCCKNIRFERETIQEVLQKYCNSFEKYGTGHTVALHMLAVSILSGCKDIYIYGVDLDYKKGYVKNDTFNNDSFDFWLDEILEDFSKINKSALNIGVNIYSCSINSPINSIFEYREINLLSNEC